MNSCGGESVKDYTVTDDPVKDYTVTNDPVKDYTVTFSVHWSSCISWNQLEHHPPPRQHDTPRTICLSPPLLLGYGACAWEMTCPGLGLVLGISHALVVEDCQQVVQKADGIDADISVAGAQCQDQLKRHNAFLKRSSDTSASTLSWRPKKRHRVSVTKCMRVLDNHALGVGVGGGGCGCGGRSRGWVWVGVGVGSECECVSE